MKKKIRKIIAFILVLPVTLGVIYIYNQNNIETYAVDPLIVTYAGGPPPDPMITLTNMLPGDEEEWDFNVENDSPEDESVTMQAIKTDEDKDFAGILDVEIIDMSSADTVFSGKLQELFNSAPISIGNFPAGTDKDFRVKVKFPFEAGNEYQNAFVKFDIIWRTEFPDLEIPEDCSAFEAGIENVIEGTDGVDWIRGTSGNDLIIAKGGVDIVDAGRGNDIILGGEGNDWSLDGSDGNDCIVGGPGNDDIDGSDGNDLLFGNDGDDEIDGSDNDDIIFGGLGDDDIDGGGDQDIIYGEEGEDEIKAGSGNDLVYGGDGNDEIDGESGDDEIYGNEGDDVIDGGSGMDFIDGGQGYDEIDGGSNTDECINGELLDDCES